MKEEHTKERREIKIGKMYNDGKGKVTFMRMRQGEARGERRRQKDKWWEGVCVFQSLGSSGSDSP